MNRPWHANLMLKKRVKTRLLVTTAVAGLFAFVPFVNVSDVFSNVGSAQAQSTTASQIFGDAVPQEDDQLLLESDDLIFDNDRQLVIATGNVQIAFGKFALVADKVEYNQQSGRLIAIGNVEILEPNGNRIFAQEIDITDDFRDGFVSALNVQTPDNTRIAAESAERVDGEITSFNNGVYTACKACKENPQKPPFWQIRAKKVTIDNDTRNVEYEDATLEFFGKPLIRLSRFAHADPAIKRKSGFLIPTFREDDILGIGTGLSYFWALAPNYDLTATGTYYSRQGFLGELEWRHRVANGEYSVRYAGINQIDPDAFEVGTIGNVEDERHAVTTTGRFQINDRWETGWNALFQTDNNFARTYDLIGYGERDVVNELYLTGIGEKNFFDIRGQDFLVQDNQIDFDTTRLGNQTFDDQQATLLPSLDYNAVTDDTFEYGQVSLDINIASVSRDVFQVSNFDSNAAVLSANERFTGIEGTTTRFSAEVEWKASNITDLGAVVTTALSARGDAIIQDTDQLNSVSNPLLSNDSIYRSMPAGSLEIRYPLIASSDNASHLFEPIAQVIVRPDEKNIGEFANEDAQSLVFDTSNLFERDKFSGFDRVEGGTRANVGFRYSASFVDTGNLTVVAGQSFHLAGENSFAQRDIVNAGLESGLETDRSDYVASVQVDNGGGISAGVSVRLDESDLDLNRIEVSSKVIETDYSFAANYVFTEAQPLYRFNRDRHEVSGSGSVRIDENWRLFGSTTYDIEVSETVSNSVGIAYNDDCFSFSIGYSELNRDFNGDDIERSINFSLGLRTIGGFERSVAFDQDDN